MVNDYYYQRYAQAFQEERLKAGREARRLKAGGHKYAIWRLSLPRLRFRGRFRNNQNPQAHYRPEALKL